LVACELYRLSCPIAACPIGGIATGDRLRIDAPEGSPAVISLTSRRVAL
jgi:hypothetical protein